MGTHDFVIKTRRRTDDIRDVLVRYAPDLCSREKDDDEDDQADETRPKPGRGASNES